MKLKIMAVVLVASSSALAQRALVKSEGTGGRAEVVRSAITEGTEESKKELNKKLNNVRDGKARAQESEQTAYEELNNTDTPDVKYAKEQAVPALRRMLKDCVAGICKAFNGIFDVATKGKGNPKANITLFNAITALKKSPGGNKEMILKESLEKEGKDPKKVEDLCSMPGA